MARRRPPIKIKRKRLGGVCPFCASKTSPSYRNFEALGRYTTERGKIQDRTRIDTCSRHQKDLTLAIKRARFLALLPFVVRPR